jgi:hypothetical protein
MRVLFRELAIAKQQRVDAFNRDVALAWRTANYSRAKRLPALRDELHAVTVQTPDESLTMLQAISARYGLPLKRVRLIRRDTIHHG